MARLLDRLGEPAVVLRRDYSVVAANRTYVAARGLAPADVVGRRCFELAHGRDSPCARASCPLFFTIDRSGATLVHEHRTADGSGTCREAVTMYALDEEGPDAELFLEIVRPQEPLAAADGAPEAVGTSASFAEAKLLIDRVAPFETPVLLLGESGTGKELAARAIHRGSARAAGPFLAVDCSGLPEALFESELFGHEKGAFTGAARTKVGLVEAAGGGTLFLDEIGDIPVVQQVKLLRLLESGTYRRVGSTVERRANFRLLCATHRDLRAMVAAGAFRRDLYYRISAFPVFLAPLRERVGDVPVLAEALLGRYQGKRCRLHPDATAVLLRYAFPGNIRELAHILERACLLCGEDGLVRPEHLPPECREGEPARPAAGASPHRPADVGHAGLSDAPMPLGDVETTYLRWVARKSNAHRRDLAHRLGISERTLYRKLARIRGPTARAEADDDAS